MYKNLRTNFAVELVQYNKCDIFNTINTLFLTDLSSNTNYTDIQL